MKYKKEVKRPRQLNCEWQLREYTSQNQNWTTRNKNKYQRKQALQHSLQYKKLDIRDSNNGYNDPYICTLLKVYTTQKRTLAGASRKSVCMDFPEEQFEPVFDSDSPKRRFLDNGELDI